MLAFYISSNMLSSIPWALDYGEEDLNIMKNQAKNVLEWFDGMNNPVPTWYKGELNLVDQKLESNK